MIIKKVEVKNLSAQQISLMNKQRVKEYGKGSEINFKKEDKNSVFFFVIENEKIMAFGMLKPVTINYLNKKYKILGMGRGLAIKKGKGYGKALGLARLNYLKKRDKTGLAFTNRRNLDFFKKCGFKTKLHLIRRFRYKNPLTGEVVKDDEGEGVYFEGKDKLISKIIKGNSLAFIDITFW